MGPLNEGIYHHPWIREEYHEWTRDGDSRLTCYSYYRYPESPEYGFFVQTCDAGLYYVGPVKFDELIAERSGTAYACHTHHSITEMVGQLYLKNQGMDKAYDIEELLVAPF